MRLASDALWVVSGDRAVIDITEEDDGEIGLLAALTRNLGLRPNDNEKTASLRLLAYRLRTNAAQPALPTRGLGFTRRPLRPEHRLIGVVSSHIGRRLDQRLEWFVALRRALSAPMPGGVYIVGARAPTACWAQRWAELTGQAVRPVFVAGQGRPTTDRSDLFWRRTVDLALLHPELLVLVADTNNYAGPGVKPKSMPLADWHGALADDMAVCWLADWLQVIFLRRKGRLDKLLQSREAYQDSNTICLRLASDPKVPTPGPSRVGGHVCACFEVGQVPRSYSWHFSDIALQRSRRSEASVLCQPYLVHWTRPLYGPWPAQSKSDFLEEFLLLRPSTARSAFDVLARIVRSGRLVASRSVVQGAPPVVCFSAVQLEELFHRAVFRAHRQRWDFLPYGIAIARDWLVKKGARPVLYGDARLRASLPRDQLAFFQPTTDTHRRIDWTHEKEWRLIGDCSFLDLPVDAACLFVPSRNEARALSYMSRWPVVAMQDIKRSSPQNE